MANAAAAPATDIDVPPKPAKSRKVRIIGVIVAIAVLGGGAAYYFLSRKPPADDRKTAQKVVHKIPVYLPMDTFTVNLRDADQERFLQVTINLELADTATVDALKVQLPSVRSRLLLLLSSKTSEDLLPREGKEKLSAEIALELRRSLEGTTASKGLEQVLFSHFVIQ